MVLCNYGDYSSEYGGLKNVDVFFKIFNLTMFLDNKLFHNSFHQWKLISLYLIRQYLGKNFKLKL